MDSESMQSPSSDLPRLALPVLRKSSELSVPPSRLPRMNNKQYQTVIQTARVKNIDLNRCPTCRQKRSEVEPGAGIYVWAPSTYRLYGKDIACDCEWQDKLRRHYLLANIPMSYWTLGPDDWWGDPDALVVVQDYLTEWEDNKWVGFGLEFYSPRMGVGKTMLAAIVGKALIQAQESVYFTLLSDAITHMTGEGDDDTFKRLRESPVLILDEVGVAWTDRMHLLYAEKLEDLIRFRTAGAAVTIMTTNMTPEQQDDTYWRVFSLLAAKQQRIHVQGDDSRVNGDKRLMDLELKTNKESRPIK